jgi:hypothetical protein
MAYLLGLLIQLLIYKQALFRQVYWNINWGTTLAYKVLQIRIIRLFYGLLFLVVSFFSLIKYVNQMYQICRK